MAYEGADTIEGRVAELLRRVDDEASYVRQFVMADTPEYPTYATDMLHARDVLDWLAGYVRRDTEAIAGDLDDAQLKDLDDAACDVDALLGELDQFITDTDFKAEQDRRQFIGIADEAWPKLAAAIDAGEVHLVLSYKDDDTATVEDVYARMAPGMASPAVVTERPDLGIMHWNFAPEDADARADAIRAAYVACVSEDVDKIIAPMLAASNKVLLPLIDTTRPAVHVSPNTKLDKVLTNPGLIAEGGRSLKVSNRHGGTEQVALTNADGTPLSYCLSSSDRTVHEAICSFADAGKNTFTARQVAQHITGVDNPSEDSVEAVITSIRRLMGAYAWIDMSETFIGSYDTVDFGEGPIPITDKGQLRFRDALITVIEGEYRDGQGGTVNGFMLKSTPLLLMHAHAMDNQIVRFPAPLNRLPKGTRQHGNRTTLKVETLKWTEEVRYSKTHKKGNVSSTIRFDTLIERAGYDLKSMRPTQRGRLVTFITDDVLESLKPPAIKQRIKDGEDLSEFIPLSSYSVKEEGRAHKRVSVTIKFCKNPVTV